MAYSSQVSYDWETRKKYLDLPFPISEYQSRLEKIRVLMEKIALDCVLIFGDSGDAGDLIYVSNFNPFGRAAIVVRKEKPPIIITDAILHGEPINSYAWTTWIEEFVPVRHSDEEFASALSKILAEEKVRKIGIVGVDNLPFPIWEKLRTSLQFSWVDFWLEFTKMKSVRSDLEVEICREVGAITAKSMKSAVESIATGRTESEIASVSLKTMLELGAHDRSFQTIVNSGPKAGVKHSYPTSRKIEHGDLIYLDMGAMKFGYQADMSRSVVVGGANSQQKEVLDTVLNAYSTLTRMMRPGVKTSELIAVATKLEKDSNLREKYKDRMYLGLIVHHAIATSFFEFPSLGLSDTILQRNMSFAFEPMAHILDFGTAVIEDTVLITDDGEESLTSYELVHW
jgi:Xaa-Pro aminopeptidase